MSCLLYVTISFQSAAACTINTRGVFLARCNHFEVGAVWLANNMASPDVSIVIDNLAHPIRCTAVVYDFGSPSCTVSQLLHVNATISPYNLWQDNSDHRFEATSPCVPQSSHPRRYARRRSCPPHAELRQTQLHDAPGVAGTLLNSVL